MSVAGFVQHAIRIHGFRKRTDDWDAGSSSLHSAKIKDNAMSAYGESD